MDNQINGMDLFAFGKMNYGVVSTFRNRRDIGPMDMDIRGPDSIPEIGMVGNSDCRSAIKDAGPWLTPKRGVFEMYLLGCRTELLHLRVRVILGSVDHITGTGFPESSKPKSPQWITMYQPPRP